MPCNRTGIEQLVNVHHVLQRRLQKQFAGQGEASVGQLESLQMFVQMCNLSNIRKWMETFKPVLMVEVTCPLLNQR